MTITDLLAQNLPMYRNLRGLSQHQLADVSGVARSMIAVLELGTRDNVSTRNIDKLANALGVSVAQLLTPPGPTAVHTSLQEGVDLWLG